jgi:hypothetical protein
MAFSNHQHQTCFYIEQGEQHDARALDAAHPAYACTPHHVMCTSCGTGVCEVRYEADVPVTLSSILAAAMPSSLFRRPASAVASMGAAGGGEGAGSAHQRQPSASYTSQHRVMEEPLPTPSDAMPPGAHHGGRTASSGHTEPPRLLTTLPCRACALDCAEVLGVGKADAGGTAAGSMVRSESLVAVVEQAMMRAEALLSNAKCVGIVALLVCMCM